jgi:hypothetical protein
MLPFGSHSGPRELRLSAAQDQCRFRITGSGETSGLPRSDADDLVSFSGYQCPSEVRVRGDVSVKKEPKHLFLITNTERGMLRFSAGRESLRISAGSG